MAMLPTSLRTRILTRLAIMSLCSMSLLLVIMYHYVSHSFERDLTFRGSFLARTIAEQSAAPILTQKYLALSLLLADAKHNDRDLSYLFIVDASGNVLAHTFGDSFPAGLKEIGKGDHKKLHRVIMDNHEVLHITNPIYSGSLGKLHVGMSKRHIFQELLRIFSLASLVIIALFITAAWLFWLSLERIIIRRLQNLNRAIRKVQQEGFVGAVTIMADDEIGRLGQSFNEMTVHLGEVDQQRTTVIAELNEKNQSLTQLVLEREQTEARLAESEEKLRLILDSAGEGIFGIDTNGNCTFCNQSSIRLLGYNNTEQLIGRNVHQHIHHTTPDGHPCTASECRIYQAFLQGKSLHADDEIFWKADHSSFPVEYWSFPQIKDGRIIGTVVTFVDITKRKQAEEENKGLQFMLLQSQKLDAMGTLAGGIAHDFNNTLTVISGYTEIAKKRCGDNAKLLDNLDQVMKAAERARELVKQILAFSRKTDLEQRPLPLSPLIRETLKLIRASIPTTIEIRQQLECDAVALVEPAQIHQVVMNLCANAYFAMAEAGGTLSVSLETVEIKDTDEPMKEGLPSGSYAVIAVADNGCGMDEETRLKVFDPYFTVRENGKGSGLGLAVADGIIKVHGGRITVHTQPGRGSTFRVYLPLVAGEQIPAAIDGAEYSHTGSGQLIAFVDDEQQIRDLAKDFLTNRGYQVEVYADGIHALDRFKKDVPPWDLLITDMAMPSMSGKELVQAVLAIRADLPVILCTGFSEQINSESAKKIGCREYLQKPVLMSTLCERISILLEEH